MKDTTCLKVLYKLEKSVYKAYLVGDCVRDMLLGKEPHDIDITTSATPDMVESLFTKIIPTGKKYGTITVKKLTSPKKNID